MGGLSEKRFRYILGFLKEVYRPQTFEGFIATVFAGLKQVVPVDSVGCVEMGPEENRVWAWFDPPEVSNEKQFPVWAHVCHAAPRLGAISPEPG